jgi:uncharacterized protein (TIGR02246 family)
MKRLLVAMLLVPAPLTLAAEQKEAAVPKEKAAAPADDPMAGWVPPKLTNPARTKKEIQALFQAMEAASKRGDIEAAAALVDFPVLMATDSSKGDGMAEAWTREEWIEVMEPFYGKPMPDMKVTHKLDIFLLSDSLASVDDVATVKMGPKTMTMRNTTLAIRRDGKWLVKAMAEGGWGDMMEQMQGTAGGAQGPASEGTGSAGEETPGPAKDAPGPPKDAPEPAKEPPPAK